MTRTFPLVSIIIPTYNYGHFISSALESLIHQTYPRERMEIIVVDDGSTDNTYEIVKKYGERVKYIYQENRGYVGALNTGVSCANGEIITFLDSDDMWHSERLEKIVRKFMEDDDIGIVYHPIELIDNNGLTIYKNFYKSFGFKEGARGRITNEVLASEIFCGGSSFAFKGSLLKEFCPVPGDINNLGDYYMVALSSCCAAAEFVPEILGKYRFHGDNMTLFAGKSDYKKMAAVSRQSAYTRQMAINKVLSMEVSIRQTTLDKVKRIQAKEMIFYYILSGQRLKGIQYIPRLFKGNRSFHEFLKGLALSIMSLCMPLSLFCQFENFAGNVKKSIREKLGMKLNQ